MSDEPYGDLVKRVDLELAKPLFGESLDEVPESVVQDEMAQFMQAAQVATTAPR